MATQTLKKKGSKRYDALYKKEERGGEFILDEALGKVKENATAKFDETIEASVNLNILPKHSIRDTFVFPHSFGKEKRVIVFATGDAADVAKGAGAVEVGSEDLIEKIKGGWLEFDVAIATPAMMKEVGKIAKVLGPKGLMPNPKTGTVTDDVAEAVSSFRGGRVEFRADKTGIVHLGIGKASMSVDTLRENFMAFYGEVMKKKPSDLKGEYVKSLALTSSMGIGIFVDSKKLKA